MRVGMLMLFASTAAAADPAGVEFFEKHVRPVFAEHCYSCHGEKKQSAELRLDKKAAVFKGSDTGPVIVAGDPEKSKLIASIKHVGDAKMPPKAKLPDAAVEAVVAWVKMGAPYPDDAVAAGPDPRKHWAFQPVKDPPVPAVDGATALDKFVVAKLLAAKKAMAPEADRRTLIRRVTHDLTGLRPTPEQVDAFVADKSPDAYAKLVDRLLDSPQYGEHQARHWMDLARYSDTKGYVFNEDRNYPFAYTYRDWLIRSFNADLPYPAFIEFQLAADRLAGDDKAQLAAMGFLTVGRRFLNNSHDIIDDRIDVTFRTFQGLTVTCARCHDHKYDPIPIKDYYSLYGVFASSQEPKELPLIGEVKDTPELQAFNSELKKREAVVTAANDKLKADYRAKLKTPQSIADYLRAARDAKGTNRDQLAPLADERKLIAAMIADWKAHVEKRKDDPLFAAYRAFAAIPDAEFAAKSPAALAKLKEGKPHAIVADIEKKSPKTFADVCLVYGEAISKEEKLEPLEFDDAGRFERVINRKERDDVRNLKKKVDEWRAKSPAAPPRAMVMVEANPSQPVVFLRGNPNNRGPQVPRQFPAIIAGDARKPFADGSGRLEMAKTIASKDNPLTARVMVNRVWGHLFGQGLVRTPSDFGVRSDPPTHPELLDWLSVRFVESGWSVKKLHRLMVMSATYRQSSESPDAAADPENRLLGRMSRKRLTFEGMRDNLLAATGSLDATVGGRSVDLFKAPFTPRRSVYGFIERQNLPGTFRTFDLASPDTHAPQRFTTTVPQQALFLMNSPFVAERAKALADKATGEPAARVAAMYRLAHARTPTVDETAAAVAFAGTDPAAWEQLAQALLMSNEFAFVD